MAVTLAEIDGFLERLRDEPPGEDFSERVGRKHWYLVHGAADGYPCPPCRPTFQALANVDHNTVNVKLEKPVVNPKLYRDGVQLVTETYREFLEKSRPSHGVRHVAGDHGPTAHISHTVHSAMAEMKH